MSRFSRSRLTPSSSNTDRAPDLTRSFSVSESALRVGLSSFCSALTIAEAVLSPPTLRSVRVLASVQVRMSKSVSTNCARCGSVSSRRKDPQRLVHDSAALGKLRQVLEALTQNLPRKAVVLHEPDLCAAHDLICFLVLQKHADDRRFWQQRRNFACNPAMFGKLQQRCIESGTDRCCRRHDLLLYRFTAEDRGIHGEIAALGVPGRQAAVGTQARLLPAADSLPRSAAPEFPA